MLGAWFQAKLGPIFVSIDSDWRRLILGPQTYAPKRWGAKLGAIGIGIGLVASRAGISPLA